MNNLGVFERVIGQTLVIDYIKSVLDDTRSNPNNLSRSWLITGPAGSGRSVLANAFAAALLCSDNGCGVCDICNEVLKVTHPDVLHIIPQGLSIGVGEIRDVIETASRSPMVGKWNIIIIEDADRLTEVASNALLKTIEEPANHTIFMLCAPTTDPTDIALTIKSRCTHIALRSPLISDVATELVKNHNIDAQTATWASTVSAGHIGRAKLLATNSQAKELRALAISFLRKSFDINALNQTVEDFLSIIQTQSVQINEKRSEKEMADLKVSLGFGGTGKGLNTVKGSQAPIKSLESDQKNRLNRTQRDMMDLSLLDMAQFLRDAIMVKFKTKVEPIHIDYEDQIQKLSENIPEKNILECIEAINKAREDIINNIKPKFVLLALMATFHINLSAKRN